MTGTWRMCVNAHTMVEMQAGNTALAILVEADADPTATNCDM